MQNQIPQFFKEMLLVQYGEELTNKIIEGYSKQRLVTLRINTIKSNKENIKTKLQSSLILLNKMNAPEELILLVRKKVKELDD